MLKKNSVQILLVIINGLEMYLLLCSCRTHPPTKAFNIHVWVSYNCACVPYQFQSLFWVGQCLLLGLPLFVLSSSDCRLYFRQCRNVLAISVLTDSDCCCSGLQPFQCMSNSSSSCKNNKNNFTYTFSAIKFIQGM